MNRVLIDTNIYSHALRGEPGAVESLRRMEQIGFSVISIGELLYGFRAGKREKQNREELNRFLDSPRVELYTTDDETAERYADIRLQLKRKGTPIPTNDLWIAATAFQHGLTLFTYDSDFQKIPGLSLFDIA